MEPIYIFSGLGADERVFHRLDFSGRSVVFIRWIEPLPNEPISHYASRLLEQIPASNPVFLGLSFGGMMAMEVAKLRQPSAIILISSAKTKSGIPFYFRWVGMLGLHTLIPAWGLKTTNPLMYWAFGVDSTIDKKLLAQILQDTNPKFLTWAIGCILCWENTLVPSNTHHIHGTRDRILPHRFVKADDLVEGGGHLMVLDRAAEISGAIGRILVH